MPHAPRAVLALLLTTLGALLLALAVVDWTAHDFAALEIPLGEWRRHERIGGDSFPDPWSPSHWWDVITSARHTTMLALAVVAALAALAAARSTRPRISHLSLALAIACTATIAAFAVSAMSTLRATNLAGATLERISGLRLRWLTPEFMADRSFLRHLELTSAAMMLLMLLVPVIAYAGIRITRRPTAVSTGLLATLTAFLILDLRLRHFADFPHPIEGWTGYVATSRLVLIATAVLCVIVLLRAAVRRGSPRLLPALATLAVGLAAFTAAAPHRNTSRNFYPQRDPGFHHLAYHWLTHPEILDPPRVDACAHSYLPWHEAALRPDQHGALVLDMDGVLHPLRGNSFIPVLAADRDLWASEASNLRAIDRPVRRDLFLLIDRRVSVAALTEFLNQLPASVDDISAIGAFTQTLPSADGPIETWTVCKFAELRRDVLLASVPDDMTWGDLVDYPGDRFLLRPDPSALFPPTTL